ncbi:non-ribosomal peptide synthetase, partial [Scytonema sp. NUACC21]
LYGPTEAAIDVTYWRCQPGDQRKTVPIGRPITNTQIYLLDRFIQPVPIGVPGELHIGGEALARGYLNRPKLNSQKFIPNPFRDESGARLYKTGDLARYLPDGNIEFLGRIDYQVKIRGFRIELGEIEAALNQHPQVRETIIIAHEEQPGDKRLIAYVVPQQSQPTVKDLSHFLRQKLPDYMLPSTFLLLESLPLTPNGKVNRLALPSTSQSRLNTGEVFEPPRNFVEEELVAMWSELLNVDRISIYDNFFELGGHSLLLTQLASRIRAAFDVNISLIVLFNKTTVAEMGIAITDKMLEQENAEDVAEILKEVQELPLNEVLALLENDK